MARALVSVGDRLAGEELSSRVGRCVHSVLNERGWHRAASAETRRDIIQECLLRLIDRMQKGFDGIDVQFRSYLYKVVYSVTATEVSRSGQTVSLDQEVARADGSAVPLRELIGLEIAPWLTKALDSSDPVAEMERADQAARVTAALARLRREDREALRLFEVERLSSREVAARLRTTDGNIWVRLYRARERLYRAYLFTFFQKRSRVDEGLILDCIERLPAGEAAVMGIWWKEGMSVRKIAKRLQIPEDACRDLLDRGRANLAGMLEERADAS